MTGALSAAVKGLNPADFLLLYGPWDPLEPHQVPDLLTGAGVRWYIAGGRAARRGAPPRDHEDTDVAVRAADLGRLRAALAGWHLWEADSGSLRPLLPGVPVTPDTDNLWLRRSAQQPWQVDFLLDRSEETWVYKRDARIHLPWERAVDTVDGVPYLRPEIALLHKAHMDRPKDRADLAAAVLEPGARDWLARQLDLLGHRAWAQRARRR